MLVEFFDVKIQVIVICLMGYCNSQMIYVKIKKEL